MRPVPALLRFVPKIRHNASTGCWLWTGAIDRTGYGRFRHEGRFVAAHRVAYLLLVGPIPDDLELDHLCRVRRCVNPEHLEAVTHQINQQRGVAARFAGAGR